MINNYTSELTGSDMHQAKITQQNVSGKTKNHTKFKVNNFVQDTTANFIAQVPKSRKVEGDKS